MARAAPDILLASRPAGAARPCAFPIYSEFGAKLPGEMKRRDVHIGAACVALALGGCQRADEAEMRARLAQWFHLGATHSFSTEGGCAAGVFLLADADMRAALPVAGSVPEMLRALPRKGVAMLDDPAQAPDAALAELANADRATGMTMRRIGLEARACMGAAQGDFRRALLEPDTALGFDRASGMLILMNRDARAVFAAMGER